MKFQVKIFSGSKDTEGDGPTDRRTDGRTDGQHGSYRSLPDLKTVQKWKKNGIKMVELTQNFDP